MKWSDWVNAAILALTTATLVFKWMLWRLTRFWPFLFFFAALVWERGMKPCSDSGLCFASVLEPCTST